MTSVLFKCLLLLSVLSFCAPQPNNQEQEVALEENTLHRRLAPNNADFAFSLYKTLISRAPEKNIFISPVSISMSLAMLALGAKSAVHTQLLEGLGFNLTETSDGDIHQGFQYLLHLFNNSDTSLDMNIGNALFLDLKITLLETFTAKIKQYYNAEIFHANFQDAPTAKKQINDFVKNKTLGKVDQLVKELNEDTILILISYIFFKGRWSKPFDPNATRVQEFYLSEKVSVNVPMMFQSDEHKILYDKELSCMVVQLEYSGNATAFFILPDEGKMDHVVAALSRDTLEKWSYNIQERKINLYIPKFCIFESYDLEDALKEMGMTILFSSGVDFSGITGNDNIKLSEIFHKAVLSIDEEGTEAAAGSGAKLHFKSAPHVIKFNRPFLFVMFDHFTWSSLFLGKIMNPT